MIHQLSLDLVDSLVGELTGRAKSWCVLVQSLSINFHERTANVRYLKTVNATLVPSVLHFSPFVVNKALLTATLYIAANRGTVQYLFFVLNLAAFSVAQDC